MFNNTTGFEKSKILVNFLEKVKTVNLGVNMFETQRNNQRYFINTGGFSNLKILMNTKEKVHKSTSKPKLQIQNSYNTNNLVNHISIQRSVRHKPSKSISLGILENLSMSPPPVSSRKETPNKHNENELKKIKILQHNE